MAEELVLNIDYDISAAEMKQKKLDDEFEKAKQKLADTSEEAQALDNILQEQLAELQKATEEWRKQKNIINDLQSQLAATKSPADQFDLRQQLDEANAKLQQIEQKQERIGADADRTQKALDKANAAHERASSQLTNIAIKEKQVAEKAQEATTAQSNMPPVLSKAGTALDKFSKRIIGLAKRVFIFSVITMALRKLRKAITDMIGQDSELQQYVKQIKGNLSVMGRTLFESLRPVITWLLQKIAYLTQLLAVILAKVLKKDVKQMADMAKSSAKTAKNAEKTTAAFDTLQKIDTTKNDNDEADAGASFEQFNVASWTDEQLAKIMAIAGVALIAIGLILCFFGHIGLGVAAIAAGIALEYTAARMSNELEGETKAFVTKIMLIAGAALLAIGIILCLFQQYMYGIPCIIAGLGLVAAAVALNWGTIKERMTQFFEEHKELIGHFLIVLGVILCLTGIGALLGVSLIKKGAEDLVEADPEKYGWLEDTVIPILDRIKTTLLGGFLVVLGVVLCATGVGIPLGLSLIKKGMGDIYSGITGEDSDAFYTWLDEKLQKVKDAIFRFFDSLPDGVKVFVNGIIKGLNWLIEKANNLIAGINGISFGDWSPNLPYINYIPYLNVPKLAKGAVIPGGSPFLAMLGDQRRGQTNIETPLETMIEAFKAAQSETNVNIEFTGSLSQLARLLNPQIRKEQKRASIW